VSHYLKCVL